MRDEDLERISDFIRRKMCSPCRRGDLDHDHEGCVEAVELIAILDSER